MQEAAPVLSIRKYILPALLLSFLFAALTLLSCLPFLESFCQRQWLVSKIEIRNAGSKGSMKTREIGAARKQLFYAELMQILQGDILNRALAESELARVLLSARKFPDSRKHAGVAAGMLQDFLAGKNSSQALTRFAREELISSLYLLGLSQEESGNAGSAIESYEKARQEFKKELKQSGSSEKTLLARELVDMLSRYGQCLKESGKIELSNDVVLEAIELCRQQGNLEFMERRLRKLLLAVAGASGESGMTQKDELRWQSLIDESDQLSSEKHFEAALQKLIEASRSLGEAGAPDNKQRQAAIYLRLATVYMDLFQYENSLAAGLKAVNLVEADQLILQKLSKREISNIYKSTSLSAYKLDRYENLATVFEKAWQLQVSEEGKSGLRSLFAEARYALALARNLQFEQAEEIAKTCFAEASKMNQESGKQLGLTFKLLGETFFEAGSYKQAAAGFAKAYESFLASSGEESGYSNVSRVELCASLCLAGQKEQAKELLKKNQVQFANWSRRSEKQKESLIKQTLYLPGILKKLKRSRQAEDCLELLKPSLRAVDPAAAAIGLDGL